MKTLAQVAKATHFTAANVGPWSQLNDYLFPLAPGIEIPGRVMLGEALQCSGTEVSITTTPAGAGGDFLHTHTTNEELYVVVSGEGEFQVDGDHFPLTEGTVVRVAPAGKRAFRNTGTTPLVMICIQSKSESLSDLGFADAQILDEKIAW